jgi:mannitol 2-dehydrogenase
VDARADALANRARSGDPLAFVSDRELFGDLADDPRFAAAYRDVLTSLRERGARATVESLLPR